MITSTPTFGSDVDDPDTDVPDPIALMKLWLPPNTSELRPLMTLATHGGDGYPDARNVLASAVDDSGLHFHTDAKTRKAQELAADPRACAVLVWPDVGRQLVLAGDVTPEPPDAAAAVYAVRGAYLRTLAWVNSDETAQLPLPERRRVWAEHLHANPDETLQPPPGWIGFVLRPHRLTFWRGDPDGPSNRVEYRRVDGGWDVRRLAG